MVTLVVIASGYIEELMAVSQREISLIFDFDETLTEDSTAAFVKSRGLDPQKDFYELAAERVANGWDPPLAYLTLMCDMTKDGRLQPIRRSDFLDFGRKLKPYPGVQSFLRGLRKKFEADALIKEAEVSLAYYIISGGIGDIIRSVSIVDDFKEVWACEFDYDAYQVVSRPKAVITFSEKTKFLFYINKGITGPQSRQTPYAVNVELKPEDRPVPFCNMIYVGDGPSDVPCMSLLNSSMPPGRSILVVADQKIHKSWELLG